MSTSLNDLATWNAKPTRVKSLGEYVSIISNLHAELNIPPSRTLWFRGQSNADWGLLPSQYRSQVAAYFEREIIRDFKQRALSYLSAPPSTDIGWLFLMQHYGVPTRLLDWTESHLLALFFAVQEIGIKCDAAVWILRPAKLNEFSIGECSIITDLDTRLNVLMLPEPRQRARTPSSDLPVAFRPTRGSPRIVAQQGVFTFHGRSTAPLQDIVKDANNAAAVVVPLLRLVVDWGSRLSILKELTLAGISFSSVWPELDGLCADLRFRYSAEMVGLDPAQWPN
jgi:FRG domain